MIRVSLLYVLLLVITVVAVRRWYAALCALVFLTVLSQHPDMPSRMFGIQGLNPWNAILLVVVVSWLLNRSREPAGSPAPLGLRSCFAAYVVVLVGSGVFGALDVEAIKGSLAGSSAFGWVLVDGLINPLKYLVVGVLFFEGARTRRRVLAAVLSAVGSSMCYAFLMFKSMKLRIFHIDYEDARRLTDKLVGLFANDLGKLFAITLWAAVVVTVLWRKRWQQAVWLLLATLVVPPFVALKSRAGYVAFCAIGLALGVLRWRRILILMPVAIAIVLSAVPSVRQRVTSGFLRSGDYDWDEVSAGRLTNIWPPVVRQIEISPFFGHGRYAILREECHDQILALEHEVPSNPHSSYLEILLDTGLVGLMIVLCFSGIVFQSAWSLMRTRGDPLVSCLGAVALIATVGELTAGLTGSSFYPTQSMVPLLCVGGAALRAHVELRFAARQPQQSAHGVHVIASRQTPHWVQST